MPLNITTYSNLNSQILDNTTGLSNATIPTNNSLIQPPENSTVTFASLPNEVLLGIFNIIAHIDNKNDSALIAYKNLLPLYATQKSFKDICNTYANGQTSLLYGLRISSFMKNEDIFKFSSLLKENLLGIVNNLSSIINLQQMLTKETPKEEVKKLRKESNLYKTAIININKEWGKFNNFGKFIVQLLDSSNLSLNTIDYLKNAKSDLTCTGSAQRHMNLMLLSSSHTGNWLLTNKYSEIEAAFNQDVTIVSSKALREVILESCNDKRLKEYITKYPTDFFKIIKTYSVVLNLDFNSALAISLIKIFFNAELLDEENLVKYLKILPFPNDNNIPVDNENYIQGTRIIIAPLCNLPEHKIIPALEFIYHNTIENPIQNLQDNNIFNNNNIFNKINILLKLLPLSGWNIEQLQHLYNTDDDNFLSHFARFFTKYQPSLEFLNKYCSNPNLVTKYKQYIIHFAEVEGVYKPNIYIKIVNNSEYHLFFDKSMKFVEAIDKIISINSNYINKVECNLLSIINMNEEDIAALQKLFNTCKAKEDKGLILEYFEYLIKLDAAQLGILCNYIKKPKALFQNLDTVEASDIKVLLPSIIHLFQKNENIRNIIFNGIKDIKNPDVQIEVANNIAHIKNLPIDKLNLMFHLLKKGMTYSDAFLNLINNLDIENINKFIFNVNPLLTYPRNQRFIFENYERISSYEPRAIENVVEFFNQYKNLNPPRFLDLAYQNTLFRLANLTDAEIQSIPQPLQYFRNEGIGGNNTNTKILEDRYDTFKVTDNHYLRMKNVIDGIIIDDQTIPGEQIEDYELESIRYLALEQRHEEDRVNDKKIIERYGLDDFKFLI